MPTFLLSVLIFLTMIPAGAFALPLVMKVPGPKANTVYRIPPDSDSKARIGIVFFLLIGFGMSVIVAHSLVTGIAPCPSRRCHAEFHRGSTALYWPVVACLYAGGALMTSLAYYWFRYLRKENRT